MSGFLRTIGIINAAVWFGAAIFFAAGILPAVFSQDMRAVFGAGASAYYPGAVGLVLFHRFFELQYICGTVAVLHLLAEKFYTGRSLPRVGASLVAVIFGLGLLGGVGLQPRMETLHHAMYSAAPEQKEAAKHSFWMWHGLSQFANLIIIGGLLWHLLRVSKVPTSGRHGSFYQIP